MSALDRAGGKDAMANAFFTALGTNAAFIDRRDLDKGLEAVAKLVKQEFREYACETLHEVRDKPIIKVNIGPIKIRILRWGEIIDQIMTLLTGYPCPTR